MDGDGVTADARSDHHWQTHPCIGSQALGEVCRRLIDVFLWQIFLEFPRVTVNPLDLGWHLCIILQQGASDVTA